MDGPLRAYALCMWWLVSMASAAEVPRPIERCVASGTLDAVGREELELAVVRSHEDADAGERLLDGLVERYPACAAVWGARAAVRHASGEADGALEDLRHAVEQDPGSPDARRALAVALHHRGRAGEALDEAVLLAPTDGLLKVLQALERPVSERPELLRAALRAHPDDPTVAAAAVEGLVEAGRPLEAVAMGRAALTAFEDAELEARLDDLAAPFGGEAPSRSRRPAEYRRVADADLEVVVYSPERARRALESRLADLGWTRVQVVPGGMRYRHTRPVQPWIDVFDDGEVVVQERGLVKGAELPSDIPNLPPDQKMIPVISARKLRPDRVRLMEDVWYEVTVWRQALVQETFQREVDTALAGRLTALWEQGVPLFGDGIVEGRAARRSALLTHWSTRICSPDGAMVRAAVERFLRRVVQESADPVTDVERRAAEDACPCIDARLDLEGRTGPP